MNSSKVTYDPNASWVGRLLKVSAHMPRIATTPSKLQQWTRNRNWLKGRIMGCFAAFNSFAHRYSVYLSDEEKMKIDLIMNQVDELMKDWREQQIKMKETIK